MVETRSRKRAPSLVNTESVRSKRTRPTTERLLKKRSTKIVSRQKSDALSVSLQTRQVLKKTENASAGAFAEPQPSYKQLHQQLVKLSSNKRAAVQTKYFRVEEYKDEDVLMGITMPDVRSVSKDTGFFDYPLLKQLVLSKYHEERLLALVDIVNRYKIMQSVGDDKEKESIFNFYVNDMRNGVNNWDLVDVSAKPIVGAYLHEKPELKQYWLYDVFAKSDRLWDRRIAMVATHYFIAQRQFDDTLRLAETFLGDPEDLLHKATGWMLREMGKQDKAVLVKFLDKHAARMPRVMLRYSIEKFSPTERNKYTSMRK